MAEEKIHFQSGKLRIEGLLDERPGDAGVVLAAAHPLYGASMEDEVIAAMRVAYHDQGFTTLRFNYRGVGGSEGPP